MLTLSSNIQHSKCVHNYKLQLFTQSEIIFSCTVYRSLSSSNLKCRRVHLELVVRKLGALKSKYTLMHLLQINWWHIFLLIEIRITLNLYFYYEIENQIQSVSVQINHNIWFCRNFLVFTHIPLFIKYGCN